MPDIIVRNQSELDAAIKAAKGGETIKLAAGTYTSITVHTKTFTTPVTITSLDASKPVNVTTLQIINSSNLVVKNVTAAQNFQPAQDYNYANRIIGSSNVVIDGVTLSGGTGDVTKSMGWGLLLRESKGVTIKNSSVDHFALGMNVLTVDGVTLQGNNFHDNRRDHTNFAEASNVVIDNNMFTNLYPVNGEHPDAIQFMTNGKTKGNTNITITNNVMMQGDGLAFQGVFMGNESSIPYENITIKNNLVYQNGFTHGINVVLGKNVTVDSNTIISKMDAIADWIRLDGVTGGKVTNNVVDQVVITATSSGITQSNNAVLATDAVTLRKIGDLMAGSKAQLANLIVSGVGYQPPAGSAFAAQVAKEQAAAQTSTGANLLLDLQFTATGIVDQTRWSTDETTKALDLTAISNGMFQVKTGTGFELTRDNSRQLFALPAFTLNFDMKRATATGAVGQIMGVNQSWGISLRADGELVFTVKNAAGQSYTVATSGAKMTDTATHKIALTYDSAKGKAIIYVDGVVKGSGTIVGSTRAVEYAGLYIGSPFNAAFSGSVGEIEMRDAALSASQILALNAAATAASQPTTTVKPSLTSSLAASAVTILGTPVTSTALPAATTGTLTLGGSASTASVAQVSLAQAIAMNAAGTAAVSATGSLSVANSLFATKKLVQDFYHV
ncbi:LamG-like jellyroll fold domain-containing protein [Sphingomonas sp. R1]|uniref:LamG-like jellyroll fold domain-containing protein n=1 Tax=Sphingomonas sp. R1 TaxID=399176 RepID=UPI002224BF5F|nr:LamG-like jellyroll fold domain-containing protein [Sphingomonas sp. R1]UYY79021.1 right-handed parallel beta-helix repeat-containing protein [Sphingomonas sp. R1]